MKIKNIRQYRTFYKEQVRQISDPSRNEHFLGNYTRNEETNEKEFGWFDIYHGDKEGYGTAEEGIKNFLQSFLDMAKDGQAVYEFLQNAVDAGSSHFTMVWGKDSVDGNYYVMVANNGEMFNQKNIRSILNVGSSTKTADSQNIGKFGIGFKLAHRLVGKENGLDELLSEDPSGPILFSWKNNEIEELALANEPIPTDVEFEDLGNDDYEFKDINPWLFKILITCFPTLPENTTLKEKIKLTRENLSIETGFKKSEYETLCRWVRNYKDILTNELYKEGSLFFIKLGTGKEHDLADKNLAEGVKFSLAILQETAEDHVKSKNALKTVQLNRNVPIEKPDLNYLFFKITKNEHLDDYLFIRFGVRDMEDLDREQKLKYQKEADIEVLFGFRTFKETKDYFKGAPNFYLYFPLSEEVHNFNFVLHSNAFYKASSRTFLHKGTEGEDGINERLLKTIAHKMEEQLRQLFQSEKEGDKEKFLNLYAALLTSTESTNNERQWVKAPFVNELSKILKKIIPVRVDFQTDKFQISSAPPVIKKTLIEIPPEAYGIANLRWFYWGIDSPINIIDQAIPKLSLKVFNIFKVLLRKDIYRYVNAWIEEDPKRIEIILEELRFKNDEDVKSEHFKENFKKLKLFRFSDGTFISDEELVSKQHEGYIVLHKNLKSIEQELTKIGLHTTSIDLDELEIYSNYNPYFSTDSQLRNHAILIDIVSKAEVEKLTMEEKWTLFKTFRDATEEGKRIERLGELRLFQNNLDQCVPIKNLLSPTDHKWLQPFQIKEEEAGSEINRYLVSNKSLYYERIIFPYWPMISEGLANRSINDQKRIFNEITEFYLLSQHSKEKELQLNKKKVVFFKGASCRITNVFYHPDLSKVPVENYSSVQNVVFENLQIQIPDYDYLQLYNAAPFELESKSDGLPTEEIIVTLDDAKDLLHFWNCCSISILSFFNVKYNSDNSLLIYKGDGRNFWTTNIKLKDYIIEQHSQALLPLPEIFDDFPDLVSLKNNNLIAFLINSLKPNEEQQFINLLEASLNESEEILLKLFHLGKRLILDSSWIKAKENNIQLNFAKRILGADPTLLKDIQHRIIFKNGANEVPLNSIDSANDSVVVAYRNKEINLSRSLILNFTDNNSLVEIQKFAMEVVEKDILTQNETNAIFKLRKENITEELINQFLKNSDKKIANTDQLLLVLITRENFKEKYDGLKILNQENNWDDFRGNWILPNPSIGSYDPRFVLSTRYGDLGKKLEFGNNDVFFYGDINKSEEEENIILPFFQFRKGCTAEVLQQLEDKDKALKDIYNLWLNTPKEIRCSRSGEEWDSCLDFEPGNKLLCKYVFTGEELDDNIIDWVKIDFDNKIDFLKDLGVQTNGSDIARLRNWLMSGESSSFSHGVEQIPEYFLENTLLGLAEGFLNQEKEFETFINSKQHEVLVRILEHLYDNGKGNFDYRILVYSSGSTLKMGSEQEKNPKYLSDENYQILIDGDLDIISNFKPFTDIIHSNPKYNNLVGEYYQEQNINYEFESPGDNAYEHEEPFYKSWRNTHNVRLFKVPSLNYNAILITEEDKISLGIVSFNNYHLLQLEDEWHLYYNYKISLEKLVEELRADHKDNFATILEELIIEKDKMLNAFYNAINSSGRGEIDDEDLKRLYDNLKERNSEEERKKIISNIEEEERYSYEWFLGYVEYLLSFENLEDTTAQKTISFQKIEPCLVDGNPSKKHFLLRGATSMIPVNIEAFEDFKITFIFNGQQPQNLLIEGVSKKGQDLQIYVPQGIDQVFVNNFSKVLNIKISFSPVLDLIQKLYNAFNDKNILTPWVNIKEELQAIHFIYGPPGTGKTTKICTNLKSKYLEDPFFKALILVPTNKAGDVIAKKLLSDGTNLSIVRIGSPTDPELEALDSDIYQPSLEENNLDSKNVIISTIHRFPYYQITREYGAHYKLFSSEINWDMVIFDEASMIGLPYIVLALMSLKETNTDASFIVAGDPKQIPPVVDTSDKNIENLDIDDENIYKMLGIHSFRENEQQIIKRDIDVIENLTSQYRSIEAIGKLFSSFSYDNLLSHKRNMRLMPEKKLPASFIDKLKAPVSLVNFPIDMENSVLEPRKLLYSSYHVYAGILTTELIKNLDRCNIEKNQYNIGIVSPYKAQSMLMNKLITSSGISSNINIHCDTVHGFQGDECDIIIFVVNPNNRSFTGHKNSLLNKEYIYNVAMSRARDYLWVLNPFDNITNNPYINLVRKILGPEVNVLPNKTLESYLFNDSNFIVSNSYLTGHDNINVFGQMDMKYFIKAGNTAIDIQLINHSNGAISNQIKINNSGHMKD